MRRSTLLLIVIVAMALHASSASASQKIIVPLFTENPAELQSLISTVAQGRPTATGIVVDFGLSCRTATRDANLAAAIASAQASGLQVFGYITSRLACAVVGGCGASPCDALAHDVTSMQSYIASWYNWYGVNGIFIDEGLKSSAQPVHDYYQALYDYVKTVNTVGVNGRTVVLNMSGFQQDPGVFSLADIVLLWEGACKEFLNPSWQPYFNEPPDSFFNPARTSSKTMLLANECASNQLATIVDVLRDPQHDAGYVYIYDGTAAAYDHVPAYWLTEVSLVSSSMFVLAPEYAPPADFAGRTLLPRAVWNAGVQSVDLNNDGKLDLLQGWYDSGTSYRNAWINSGSGYVQAVAFSPPADFAGRDSSSWRGWDSGLRLADLNQDGKPDLVQGWYNWGTSVRRAWLNNGGNCSTAGCAWTYYPQYAPPADFSGRDAGAPGGWDSGVRLADVNGDGRIDLIQGWYNYGVSTRSAWTNTGVGWSVASGFAPPADFAGRDGGAPGGWDAGLRLTHLNADTRIDLIQGWYNYGASTRRAWTNTGSGWSFATSFAPPADFSARDSGAPGGWDNGIRLIDLNGDGKIDLIQGWYNYGSSTRNAWTNTGNGWAAASGYAPPADFSGRNGAAPAGWDAGLRLAALDSDTKIDLIQGWYNYGSSTRNAWTNTGLGWAPAPAFAPPADFAGRDSSTPAGWDNGVRILDINGDSKPAVLKGMKTNGESDRTAWKVP